jgi:pimeloyl-ACP methyl ester carboxylesterase
MESCQLIHFPATDGVILPGLLYEPSAGRRTGDAALFLHGNGDSSVFYSARTPLLAAELLRRGIAFFPFNNRGAHLIKRLTRSRRGEKESITRGMAHELIRESVYDISGAVAFLRRSGYRRVHLIGHSSGANKISVFDDRVKRSPAKSYILLAGGDDSGLYRTELGRRRWQRAMELCRERIRQKRGDELVPAGFSPFPISWRSLYDTINPDGDYNVFPFLEVLSGERVSRKPLFRHYRSISRPSLVVYGDQDIFCYGQVERCVEILREKAPRTKKFRFEILEGADHGFSGREGELGGLIGDWISGLQRRKSKAPRSRR